MATGTARSRPAASPPAAGVDHVIEKQLTRTRSQVKFVDLSAKLMKMGTAFVGFMLVVVLVDHWVIPLGFWGRLLALGTVVAGLAYCLTVQLSPLLIRRINPVYAARVIEISTPTLKNSLVNFLMFRPGNQPTDQVVYRALENRAATDLAQINVETAVDRSHLIRVGYVLAGLVVVGGLYTILSPKSPMQTIMRVAAPWSDIQRPTRVQLTDIEPGNATLFHGRSVTISAMVSGVDDDELVRIVYRAAEGDTSEREVMMIVPDGQNRHQCVLPPAAAGIQQDLIYRVESGDSRSEEFRLTVFPAPTILVEQIEYDFPAYTGRVPVVTEKHGGISGLEGTRVTIHARANHPISSAFIEFNPDVPRPNPATEGERLLTREKRRVQFQGQEASCTFTLALMSDRVTPRFDSYQLTFVTSDGHASQQPILHPIDVMRDLDPEIEFLSPDAVKSDVPLDGSQRIEIRALDPDFGLTHINLRGVSGDEDVFDELMFENADGQSGQLVKTFNFRPQGLRLNVGQKVTFWATATDNRLAPERGLNQPNSQSTRKYQFTIVEAKQQPAAGQNENPQENPNDPPMGSDVKPNDPPPDQNQGDAESQAPKPNEDRSAPPNDPRDDRQPPSDRSNPPPVDPANQDPQDSTANPTKTDPNAGSQEPPSSDDTSAEPASGESNPSQPDGSDGSGSKQGSDETTSNEPLHDGEVIEKTLEHLQEKHEQKPDSGQTPQGDQQGQQDNNPQNGGDQAQGEQPRGEAQGGEQQQGEQQQGGEQQGGQQQSEQQQGGQQQGGQQQGEQQQGGQQQGEQQQDGQQQGGQQQGEQQQGGQQQGGQQQGEQQQGGQQQGGQQQGGQQQGGQQQGGQQQGEQQQGGQQQGEQQQGGQQQGGQQQGGQPQGGQQQGEQQQGGQQQGGQQQGGQQQGGQQQGGQQQGGQPQGGQQQGGQPQGGQSQQSSGGQQDPMGQQSGGQGSESESGSGQSGQNPDGAPSAQGQNRDRPKDGSSSGGQSSSNQPQSPSQSGQQSDSQGDSSGDQSGGGGQGGGQGANQPGSGSSGSNTPGDQGSGAANQPGQGETGSQPGGQQPGSGQGGDPSGQPGSGQAGSTGQQSGGNSPSSGGQSGSNQPGGSPSSGGGTGLPQGGGISSGGAGSGSGQHSVPEGDDEANLDYARKATDLVLEHLEDQQDNPDQELLDRLNWSKDDLREFVERWKKMKESAQEDNDSREVLDQSLRSLGLGQENTRVRSGGGRDDQTRGMRDAGNRSEPPPGFRELFNAYKKGVARGSSQ